MIRFGIPTVIEGPEARQGIALCRRLGFDFLELNMCFPEYWNDCRDAARMRSLAREEGVGLTLHLDERLDPCDFNPLLRDAAAETVRRALAFAAEAGARRAVMHLNGGTHITLPEGKPLLYELHEARYVEALASFRDAVRGMDTGIPLCVENTGWRPFERRAVDLMLESPAFALCWDTGHDHAAGGIDEDFMRAHADRVAHMHLHDALGKRNHLPPGTGEIDIADRLRFAKERGLTCVVEVKTARALGDSARYLSPYNVTQLQTQTR